MNRPTDAEILQLLQASTALLSRLLARRVRRPRPRSAGAARSSQLALDVCVSPAQTFLRSWTAGETWYPLTPARSVDLYAAFERWCWQHSLVAAPISELLQASLLSEFGCTKRRHRCHISGGSAYNQAMVVLPPGTDPRPTRQVLDSQLAAFSAVVRQQPAARGRTK